MPRPDRSGDRPGTKATRNERRGHQRSAGGRHVRGTAVTGPGNADRAGWAAQAIEAFQSAAEHHAGLDTAEAIGGLITALCHYADRRGVSFGTILTASSDAYLSQRASEQ